MLKSLQIKSVSFPFFFFGSRPEATKVVNFYTLCPECLHDVTHGITLLMRRKGDAEGKQGRRKKDESERENWHFDSLRLAFCWNILPEGGERERG